MTLSLRASAILLLTWAAVSSGFKRTEQIQALAVSKSIQNVIFAIRDSQDFELSSTNAFFPLGREFFDFIEYLQVLKVDTNKLVSIRKFAFEGLYKIHKDHYNHQLRTSEFISKLADMESEVRYGTGSAARLLVDLQDIQDYSEALVDEVVALIDRIQALSEAFADKIEDAIKDLVADVASLEVVRERASELGLSYTERYVQYSTLSEKVKTNYMGMIPVLKAYIKLLETNEKTLTE